MIPIISTILGIAEKVLPDKDKQLELRKKLLDHQADLEKQFGEYAKYDHDLRLKEFEHKGFKSWWRPFSMMALSTIMVLYLFFYYILPQIIVVFNLNVYYLEPVEMPDIVWQVFAACILGLGALRSIYDKRK